MSDDLPPAERSKVGRLIAENDLSGAGETLERRWTGEAGERASLRDLADWFNQRVLEAVLAEHDRQPAAETTETTYRLLTDDEVGPTAQTQTRRDLERKGIDVDDLEADFVSHQAIHTYLTSYRDASLEDDVRSSSLEDVEEAIDRLQSKTATVTKSNVERQRAAGNVDVGEVDVIVTIDVVCTDCGDSFTFGELIEAGGCSCGD
ncbi:hypothetical protein L593_06415 [Salinarchaeum sp. Harcht-Bsk1]|uniref:rod-determining factor RdfA n=1 Tax=Salinarchaeum sp. Harcht-Bsk1 TaxID=1333523 RepID=UPI00034245D2|nr:rod-determining factor RdfA [Salinarchaeum sp. Harcht-Bsk1]AGN01230.1 hypothetical protein L593_06415 [Salinarchaeum sp. Harcht-Bsk1]